MVLALVIEIAALRVLRHIEDEVHRRVHWTGAAQWAADKFDIVPFAGLVHLRYYWGV